MNSSLTLTNGNVDARVFEWAVLTTLWSRDFWEMTFILRKDSVFLAGKESQEFGEEVKTLIRKECATRSAYLRTS